MDAGLEPFACGKVGISNVSHWLSKGISVVIYVMVMGEQWHIDALLVDVAITIIAVLITVRIVVTKREFYCVLGAIVFWVSLLLLIVVFLLLLLLLPVVLPNLLVIAIKNLFNLQVLLVFLLMLRHLVIELVLLIFLLLVRLWALV